jgi:hypothetical protein
MPKGNKFHAKRCTLDGHSFDSMAERGRYCDLVLMQKAGEISDLRVHPKYELTIGGVKIGTFTPDFRYQNATGTLVIEDVKGTMTQAASLRIRVFEACYGLTVTIIGKNASKVRKFKTKVAA